MVVTAARVVMDQRDLDPSNFGIKKRTYASAFLQPVLKNAFTRIYNAWRQREGSRQDFLNLMRERMKILHMDEGLLKRPVNEGFSGGEKKRNEIFQMAVLEPRLCVLDETDSGLDIDALRTVAAGVNALRTKDRAMVVITHHQRILNELIPDKVHVLIDGKIAKSGGKELALELEEKGYRGFGWDEKNGRHLPPAAP